MRISSIAVTVLSAAVLTGCGSDRQREDQPIQDRMARAQQEIALIGCVQPGQLETQFVLQNVRMEPGPGQPPVQPERKSGEGERPHAQPDEPGITPYSFVQLQADANADLRQYVGQEVRVAGIMTDTGRDVTGTSGAAGAYRTPSGDASMAAAQDKSHAEKKRAEAGPIGQEMMASGTAPIVRVREIDATGNRCGDLRQP